MNGHAPAAASFVETAEIDAVAVAPPEALVPEEAAAREPEVVAPGAVVASESESSVVASQPESEQPEPTPGFLQRGRVRRRARYLRALREVQLRDLGGFLVELRRLGLERPELLGAKLEGALQTDAEVRTLERALGAAEPMREVRAAGVGGACGRCGAVHGSRDRYCAACGAPLDGRAREREHGRGPR